MKLVVVLMFLILAVTFAQQQQQNNDDDNFSLNVMKFFDLNFPINPKPKDNVDQPSQDSNGGNKAKKLNLKILPWVDLSIPLNNQQYHRRDY
uniref:CSON003103 protein n=1 Tax=Culicoides sonorensis TaxID=179676 RepID=A0A336MPD5_CULSO